MLPFGLSRRRSDYLCVISVTHGFPILMMVSRTIKQINHRYFQHLATMSVVSRPASHPALFHRHISSAARLCSFQIFDAELCSSIFLSRLASIHPPFAYFLAHMLTYFPTATAIIFLAPISAFDQVRPALLCGRSSLTETVTEFRSLRVLYSSISKRILGRTESMIRCSCSLQYARTNC